MTDRDELARLIYVSDFWANPVAAERDWDSGDALTKEAEQAAHTASLLWAAGWRKKPSREAVAEHFALTQTGIPVWEGPYDPAAFAPSSKIGRAYAMADAILALMDGPTETGASNE